MRLSFKYYDPKKLIFLILLLITGLIILSEKLKGNIPNWITLPSMSTIVLLVFYTYDKYLWKYFPYITKIPNMSGRYKGKLISNYDNQEREVVVEITQTSSELFVRQFTKSNSTNQILKSKSISSDIFILNNNNPEIIFYYQNDGNKLTSDTEKHWGFCKLEYLKSKKCFSGTYFTDRATSGILTFEYVSKNTIGDFNG